VLAVLTGANYVAEGLGHIPMIGPPAKRRDGTAAFIPPFAAVTADRVRFVGDAVAFVVAETLAAAKDAAELIEIDYQPLAAVVEGIDAVGPVHQSFETIARATSASFTTSATARRPTRHTWFAAAW